ncbi:hypothetical protein ABBQ32_000749 [Trebouxia sp. C0010 RCD-2024]
MRPFGPSSVWQAIHDGKGDEKMLVKMESWVKGGSSAAPHLQLLCFLLQSSLAAQRQLLQDTGLAERWTRGLLKLLQQPLPSDQMQLAAAAVHAMSSMPLFVQHVQADTSLYFMLTQAAAHALHSGTRLQWKGAADWGHTACDLLDSLAGLIPPHVAPSSAQNPWEGRVSGKQAAVQRHDEALGISQASQLAHALREVVPSRRGGLEVHSWRHRVVSAALKATCVLLLPPPFTHGSDARASPWLTALGPSLPSRLIALLSKDSTDISTDTWCWQALYLVQAQLSPSQQDQILQHPTAQRIPPTSILTLEPLFCSYSALRVILACRSATKSMSTLRHYTAACPGSLQASGCNWRPAAGSQPPKGSQSHVTGNDFQPEGNNFLPIGSSSLSSQATGRHHQDEGARWPHDHQGQRHHLLLPKALPQGNLSRYFDLACVTSGLRCLTGQQDAWHDAWLVLQHALGQGHRSVEGGAAWTPAVIASLQALTEAGASGSLPPHICKELAQLAMTHSSHRCSTASTPVLSSPELAYGDRNVGSGCKAIRVPPPLQQQDNTQLQLWWTVATAAACGQLGLPCELGATIQDMLADDTTADVAFELQTSLGELVMAHAAIIAAGCPKLYMAVQQQQQQQQHSMVNSAVRIHLGKSVRAASLHQVLEYLYTGQVTTLSNDEDRLALRKLAQALQLPQLAALAAGSRPTPGTMHTFLTLADIMPTQPLQLPWGSFTTGTDSQEVEERRGNSGADAHCPVIRACSDVEASDGQDGMDSRQHPSIQDLHDASTEVRGRGMLPVPVTVPGHIDILLVPRQHRCRHLCCVSPSSSSSAADVPAWGRCSTHPVAEGQGHAVTCLLAQEAQADEATLGTQQCLQVLPAHRAVLSATSAYFAAMLSDRWHASSAAGLPRSDDQVQDTGRYLPATYLPNEDMEVLSAFVCFCYTHELTLQPCAPVDVGLAADCCAMSDHCHHCWNARTAVRLSVAAEAWMVPTLQQQCLKFLTDHVPALSPRCQNAVQADMTAMHAWDLAHQLNVALDLRM